MRNSLFLLSTLIILLAMAAFIEKTPGEAQIHSPKGQDLVPLPTRTGPRPVTTNNIPHVQIRVEPVQEVNKELFRRVYAIPGIEDRASIISLPGARSMWLSEKLSLEHPEVIVAGREFAHIHPDGSLHISLAPTRAREAVKKGWAIEHPFSNRKGWEGFVMLYTPQSMDELDVTFQLIVDGFNFVTGQSIKATDFY